MHINKLNEEIDNLINEAMPPSKEFAALIKLYKPVNEFKFETSFEDVRGNDVDLTIIHSTNKDKTVYRTQIDPNDWSDLAGVKINFMGSKVALGDWLEDALDNADQFDEDAYMKKQKIKFNKESFYDKKTRALYTLVTKG